MSTTYLNQLNQPGNYKQESIYSVSVKFGNRADTQELSDDGSPPEPATPTPKHSARISTGGKKPYVVQTTSLKCYV